MRVKLKIDLSRPFATQYSTIPPGADEMHLILEDTREEWNVAEKICNALKALPPQITKVDLAGNRLDDIAGDLSSVFKLSDPDSDINRTFILVGLSRMQLDALSIQDFRNTLVALNAAAVSTLDLSLNKLGLGFSAQDLREILAELSNITSLNLSWNKLGLGFSAKELSEVLTGLSARALLNLSGNKLRKWWGGDGLTTVLAVVSARCVILSEDDLNLSDDALFDLVRKMSPTVNEIICDAGNGQESLNQARVNRILSQMRQHAVTSIEENIPDLPTELSRIVMQYATHGFWCPSPQGTNNTLPEESLDTTMILR